MENLQEKTKIFKRNDETIVKLLNIFLKKEFNYGIDMESDCNNKNLLEPTTELASCKRKKYEHPTTSTPNENNTALLEIQELLQTAMSCPKSIIEEMLTENTSVILNNQNAVERMKLEVEPALYFRGRKATDFKPKKSTTRKGKPSKPMAPRYFPDRENHHYLNLLIPNAYLLGDLFEICFEICIVTAEINGYTYYHPYFKFQVHRTDMNSPNQNPQFIFLDNTVELKPYSELLKQLPLRLVVVMHTNKELMTSEQPLKVFSSATNNNNRKIITKRYDTHKELKEAYQLHQLRFAIIPCTKSPGENVFQRHGDEQYISEISTEDKNTKIRRVKA
ncbi:unnamed protein product [Rotaria sordida]|uniref:Uncharacterized protein n=1 Tax=Rotaria sordida TaxID=392033 RepID=A0A815LBH9_9BILA|nr:unnamed protein product [Rotaria sordida]CAF1624705.1 unnamed protein product [Rotaria sordida]